MVKLYPTPIHLQPAYQGRIPNVTSLEQTVMAMQEILSIPVYPELTDNQIQSIVDLIIDWVPVRRFA